MLAAAGAGPARIGRADLATPPAEKRYRPTSPACVLDKCRRAQTDRCRHGHCAQCCRELHADPPCPPPPPGGKPPPKKYFSAFLLLGGGMQKKPLTPGGCPRRTNISLASVA